MIAVYENILHLKDSSAIPPPLPRAAAAAAAYRRQLDDAAKEEHRLWLETGDDAHRWQRDHILRAVADFDSQPVAPTKRGRITTFSRASRRRLQRMLACLRWSEIHEAAFVTLTFHEVPDDWMSDFRAFLQRLRRAGTKYIWRLELQKRGAPHFHLMVFPAENSEIPLDDLRAAWHAIAAHGSRAHLKYGWHQRKIDSFRAARAYLSKYVAKLDPRENSHVEGRRVWGASRDLPLDPQFTADVSRKNFFTLRRIARRLLRARARARGSSWKPYARSGMWIYLDVRWSLELLAFLGIRTVWKDTGRELLPGLT